jgi:hypothetical protein
MPICFLKAYNNIGANWSIGTLPYRGFEENDHEMLLKYILVLAIRSSGLFEYFFNRGPKYLVEQPFSTLRYIYVPFLYIGPTKSPKCLILIKDISYIRNIPNLMTELFGPP